ncbi:MAG TPA: hypothetical protein VNU48_01645 [Burkholderiaceae bacterium]|nr:hypothetical protein [Burkholderiaceae bacterium]
MKASHVLAALALSLTAAVSAQAQTPDAPAHGDFASRKSAILAHLDQRMAAMSAMRACVANAAARVDLKTCHEQHRAAMKPNRAPT